MKKPTFKSVAPRWGVNYDVGYIGFTFTSGALVSKGIAYFTRWDRLSDIPVSHALVVSGPNECIESTTPGGVQVSPLSKYFDGSAASPPRCNIFFRKPRGWSPEVGEAIARRARVRVGNRYGYSLIVADALTHSVVGRFLMRVTGGWSTRIVARVLDRQGEEICSELTAVALQEVIRAQNAERRMQNGEMPGCLRKHASMITPQMLFEDDAVFEEWNRTGQTDRTDGTHRTDRVGVVVG